MFGRKRDEKAGELSTTGHEESAVDWTLSMGTPEGWIPLPRRVELTEAEVGSGPANAASELWAREMADELLGADAEGREEFSEILVVYLRMSWEQNPMFGALYIPYPQRRGPEAVEAVLSVAPLERGLGTDLAAVRKVKEEAHRDLIKPREFADVELPLGPALLGHEVFRQKDLGADLVVEAVTYWCVVPQVGQLVELTVQWEDLANGDELQEQAQMMAETLEYRAL
jgi:hypothetical protein